MNTAASIAPRGSVTSVVAFLVCLAAAAGLHYPHYASYVGDINFDFYLHYNWAKEFGEQIAQGNLHPRWMFHGRLGLGEPVFVFYSPLYYYAVGGLALTGLSTWTAMNIVAVASTAVFGWLVYRTCAYYVAGTLALAIALTALASPFLVMLNYKFHGFAWSTLGYATHGLLFWALFRPGASRRIVNGWAAVAIGLAVGSHIISALVNLVAFSAVALVPPVDTAGPWLRRIGRAILSWACTAALGLGLSAIYLVPALTSLDTISTEVWNPALVFESFAWPLVTAWIYGMQWFSFQWPIPGMALVLVLAVLAYLAQHRRSSAPLLSAAAVAGLAVFFASELSYPLWAVPSPLQKINLPYRFVSVAYAIGPVAAGLALADAQRAGRTGWRNVLGCLLALTFVVGALTLYKASYRDGAPLPPELRADRYTFEAFARRLASEGFTGAGACARTDAECREFVRASGSFGGTPEYLLKWAKPAYADYAKGGFAGECSRRNAVCSNAERSSSGLQWKVTTASDGPLVLPQFHFPAWAVTIDGNPVPHTIDPATGLISVDVPPGTHVIATRWVPTPAERYGAWLSVAALLGLLGVASLRRHRSRGAQAKP